MIGSVLRAEGPSVNMAFHFATKTHDSPSLLYSPASRSIFSFTFMSSCLYRTVAILMLNALIVFACFELAAIGYFKIKIPNVISKPTEQLVGEETPREKVSYYSSQDWAERYWYEFRLSRKQQFYPFVGWRRALSKAKP